jgi:N utilization substance protein B
MAMQTLFQLGFSSIDKGEALALVRGEHPGEADNGSFDYAVVLSDGVMLHKKKVDDLIAGYAKDWDISRIAGVDLNILRVCIYEMYFSEKPVDFGVAINEAVEIAKIYGDDDSPRFINGILGNMAKNLKDTARIPPPLSNLTRD